MEAWQRRSLKYLLLTLLALLHVFAVVSMRADSKGFSPIVLLEASEDGEAEELNESVVLSDPKPRLMAFETTYAALIAEEYEFRQAQQRKAHFWRGPPAA